ncbi:MAG: alpha/beta fold hydrolase [Caldilinea sp. CFX5]|nr:alpha/beta fold hydrolase [Caldilinea sp. CFX5]
MTRLFTARSLLIILVMLAWLALPSVSQGVQSDAATILPSAAQPSPTAPADRNAPTAAGVMAVPASCTGANSPYTCTILANNTWQQTPLTLQAGFPFSIFYTGGNWTVDYRSIPYVGPAGYDQAVDSQIPPGCKFDTALPYARLLGQIGNGPLFSVGADLTFTANASGPLFLRINDQDGCLSDNDGALTLRVQDGILYSLLTGRITDANGNPLSNIRIATTTGDSTTTQADGSYSFGDQAPGTYTVIPSQSGYSFSPTERTVTVPPDANGIDFTGTAVGFACNNVTEIPTSECNALVALYNSTNGANWVNNSGWRVALTPCSWFGVTCFNGHVDMLNLPDNRLNGNLPAQLADLPQLLGIYLAGNQLSGSLPTQLGTLTQLIELDLARNQLSGTIPTQLGNLTNLAKIRLEINQLSGAIPTQLGNLQSLVLLNLCCNQLSGTIPTQLGNLTNLTDLHLSGNQLTGAIPPQIGNLTRLRELGLCCNQLSGNLPTQLGNLTNVTFLSLDGNQLGGKLPPELGNLLNLTIIHLENNLLDGPLPTTLTNLQRLATFWFQNTTLCEPNDPAFQSWLGGIADLNSTQIKCQSTPTNTPPIVSAGPDQTITSAIAILNGNVSDDGQPNPPGALTINWAKVSGPGTVIFSNPTQTGTTATFSLPGTYGLQLTAADGQFTSSDTVIITVQPAACYSLTTNITPTGAGNVTVTPAPNCQGNQYTQGTVVSLAATANTGYLFSTWSGAANGSTNPLSVTMDGNKQITANFTSTAFSCNNVTEIPRPECEALVALYNSTNGSAWTAHTDWVATLTPCRWFGIVCAGNHVTELNLTANNLRGAMPGELANLTNLAILDLSINYLNGPIPTQLGNLSRLTKLILGENELTSTIPPALSNLSNLVELSLDTNQLSGFIPPELDNLAQLDALYLSDNQLSGAIPIQLGNLTRLTALGLDNNQFTGGVPTEFGNLVNLHYLYLHNTQLSGPLPGNLVNLTKITFFDFHNTKLCEPADSAFQAWLTKFPPAFRTNVQCIMADFEATPLTGNAPLTVAFRNRSVGSFTSCTWDYGDGASSTVCADHQHTYQTAGTYTVQLTIVGAGLTNTKGKSNYITVLAPLVDAAELVGQGDYTKVTPGESVRIWINVRNSGNTTWRASDGYGWRGTGQWAGRNSAIWRDVAPGTVISFAEDVTAPEQPGEYTYGFILQHSGQDFGPHFFIKVTVISRPVVLVHGWNDSSASWDTYRDTFLRPIGLTGYAIATMSTGFGGSKPLSIDQNAQRLAAYIAWVKGQTGARKVDIVAHSMGGLIARRYIARYMNTNTPDVNQLIMLGTPNAGSRTADALELGGTALDLANRLGIPRFFPPAKELTTTFVKQFNKDNPVPNNVRFYAIAGNYYCMTRLPIANPLEDDPDDVVVARDSVFAIAEHGRWTYPSLYSAACEGDHRGMLKNSNGNGGATIFGLYVSPLLRGQMPATPPELQTLTIQQVDTSQQTALAASEDRLQLTNVQTNLLQPGGRLEFSRTPEAEPSIGFIVVGQPDQMLVSLRDPNGRILTSNTADPNVRYLQLGAEFMPMVSYTISNPVPGPWTTIIEANAQTPAQGLPVAALGSVVSDLRLTLPAAESNHVILQTINIVAQLVNGNTPLANARITGELIFPDNTKTSIVLVDDGAHGDGGANDGRYAYQFMPVTAGVYTALLTAEGRNSDTPFQRSALWVIQVDSNQVYLPTVLH